MSGLCLRLSAVNGVSTADALVMRGIFSLGFVILFANFKGLSLRPRSLRAQAIRAVVAGLALTFFTLSYEWLSASAVSVLSNVDIPFLLILGPLVGVKTNLRTQALAILSVLFLVLYVTGMKVESGTWLGLGSLGLGTLLLCFGYFFIKKSMSDENEAITILTPSLAIIVFGIVEGAVHGGFAVPFSLQAVVEAAASGASMFGAYYATMRLYEVTDIANAEFPTLLSAVAIQPLEAVFLSEPLKPTYLLSSVAFVVTIYFILQWQNRTDGTHA